MQRLTRRKRSLSTVTIPTPPDKWAESLSFDDGAWEAKAGDLKLDPYIKAVGNNSIRCFADGYNYYVACRLVLNNYVNLDRGPPHDAKINFLIQLDASMTGDCLLVLEDAVLGSRSKRFGVQPGGMWEQRSFDIFDAWERDTPIINWQMIKTITVYADQKFNQGGGFRIDQPFFSYTVADGTVTVQSSPTGKKGTISYQGQTYQIQTPIVTPILPEGTEVIISMDTNGFDHWENGDTNPTRRMQVKAGTIVAIAYYQAVTLPKLTILSLDQNMQSFPGQQAVKLVYMGIEEYVDVPFAGGLQKGTYTLVANPSNDRRFVYWKVGTTTTTQQYITLDLQADTIVEVHWIKIGNGPEIPPYAIIATIFIAGTVYVILTG